MAGREGFEPSVEFYPDNRLAGGPDRPLRHLPTILAEGEGFEPPVRFDPTVVFKTTAIVHSAIPPRFLIFASARVYHAHLPLVNGRTAGSKPRMFHCCQLAKTGAVNIAASDSSSAWKNRYDVRCVLDRAESGMRAELNNLMELVKE